MSSHDEPMKRVNISVLSTCMESIFRESDVDFLIYVNTGWQALGAMAKVNAYSETKRGIVLIPDFPSKQRISPPDFSFISDHDLEFIFVTGFENRSLINKAMDKFESIRSYLYIRYYDNGQKNQIDIITKDIYMDVVSSIFISKYINSQYCPRFIIIDAGTEDYLGTRSQIGKITYTYRTVENQIRKTVLKDSQISYRQLFTIESGELAINENIKKSYQNVVPQPTGSQQKTAMVLTQPNDALKIPDGEWISLILGITEELLSEGYDVLIKPHPCEKKEYYTPILREGVSLVQEEIDVERLIVDVNPEIAVGYTSTALLTLKVLFDIRTYSFADSEIYGIDSHINEEELSVERIMDVAEPFDHFIERSSR